MIRPQKGAPKQAKGASCRSKIITFNINGLSYVVSVVVVVVFVGIEKYGANVVVPTSVSILPLFPLIRITNIF